RAFSIVCGLASSPRIATRVSPARSTTTADTAYPFALQSEIAVSAMILAAASVRSLWVRRSACASDGGKLDIPTMNAARARCFPDIGCSPGRLVATKIVPRGARSVLYLCGLKTRAREHLGERGDLDPHEQISTCRTAGLPRAAVVAGRADSPGAGRAAGRLCRAGRIAAHRPWARFRRLQPEPGAAPPPVHSAD